MQARNLRGGADRYNFCHVFLEKMAGPEHVHPTLNPPPEDRVFNSVTASFKQKLDVCH